MNLLKIIILTVREYIPANVPTNMQYIIKYGKSLVFSSLNIIMTAKIVENGIPTYPMIV